MKLKAIHTYQTVKFCTRNYNFMTDNHDLGLKGLTLDYLPKMGAVRVAIEGKDDILIFTTNVAYAIPADAELNENMLLSRGTLKNIDPSKPIR